MTDLETIKAALSALREIGHNHRYGGMMRQYELAKRALEALERVERIGEPQKPEQLRLELRSNVDTR